MSPKNDELELRRKAEAEAETERREALEAQQAEVRAEVEGALRGQSAEDEAAAEHAAAIAWQRAEMLKEMGPDLDDDEDMPIQQQPKQEEEEQERRVPDAAVRPYVRDPDMDPAWLDRWEGEGTMTPLTDEEREKLKAIDREDPVGRGQREMFLPREVLAIRAHSDRWVAEREAAKEAKAEREPESEQKAAPQEPAAQEREERRTTTVVVKEQEQDDELEM